MRFSTRTVYGLKAVLRLASRYGEGSLPVSQIARQENISAAYLEQILNALKKKGLVKSVRGPQGGYILNQKPSEVTLDKLIVHLEGSALRVPEARRSASETDEISIAEAVFWKKLVSVVEQGLASVTLKDLIDEARRAKKSKSGSATHTFHI